MKKMPKTLLDDVIEVIRNWWECGAEPLLSERIVRAKRVNDVTGVDWLCFLDLIDSIIRYSGFLPDAENVKIYEVLRVLGWEVTDE